MKVDKIKKGLLDKKEVLAVHEFHGWQLTQDKIIATAHITCTNVNDYMKVVKGITKYFHEKGIHLKTIQLEFVNAETPVEDCLLDCSITNKQCQLKTCCGPKNQSGDTASTTDSSSVTIDSYKHIQRSFIEENKL